MLGCIEYLSLIGEHDALMVEYEARVKDLEHLLKSDKARALASSRGLLEHASRVLQEAKSHQTAHGCGKALVIPA